MSELFIFVIVKSDSFLAAFAITKDSTEIEPDELRKIEAVIYTMADKFLDSIDIEEVMGEISMTRIGQKLINEGTEQAKLSDARNLIDILDVSIIAERIGLPLETVQKIKDEYLASKSSIVKK